MGTHNLMQNSIDRKGNLSSPSAKKIISGGFGANGIPHGIDDQKNASLGFIKSPKTGN